MKIETKGRPQLDEIESAIIDIFIRATKVFGYPKSIGEIYGLLYISNEPLCMDDIIKRIGISLGAASQGLKVLKNMGAVRSNHLIGKRREYYTAEFDLDDLMNRYVRKEFSGHLKNWKQKQDKIRQLFQSNGTHENHNHLQCRLEKLEELHTKSEELINRICEELEERA